MTLSQEILVLDFGDDKQSQSLRSEASTDFSKGNLKLAVHSFSIFSNIKIQILRFKKNSVASPSVNLNRTKDLAVKNLSSISFFS